MQDIIETHIYKMGFNRVYMFTGTRTDRGVNAYRHPVVIDVEDPEDVGDSETENLQLQDIQEGSQPPAF